jgi:hypothetical protein
MLAPVGPAVWLATSRRTVRRDRVHTWDNRTGERVWGEVRTCPTCSDRAAGTVHLARLAGSARA